MGAIPRAGGKAAQAGGHLHLHQGGNRGGSSVPLHNVQGSLAEPLQPGGSRARSRSVPGRSPLSMLSSSSGSTAACNCPYSSHDGSVDENMIQRNNSDPQALHCGSTKATVKLNTAITGVKLAALLVGAATT